MNKIAYALFLTFAMVAAQEEYCSVAFFFKCGTGDCVPWDTLKDGVNDCKDGSDETFDNSVCEKQAKEKAKAIGKAKLIPCYDKSKRAEKENFLSTTHCMMDTGICDPRKFDDKKKVIFTENGLDCSFDTTFMEFYGCGSGITDYDCPDHRFKCQAAPQYVAEFGRYAQSMCVPKKFQCDGIPHCVGEDKKPGKDENFCDSCGIKGYKCESTTGQCILASQVGDASKDCDNNNDEDEKNVKEYTECKKKNQIAISPGSGCFTPCDGESLDYSYGDETGCESCKAPAVLCRYTRRDSGDLYRAYTTICMNPAAEKGGIFQPSRDRSDGKCEDKSDVLLLELAEKGDNVVFECNDDKETELKLRQVCDGKPDCPNNNDEKFCRKDAWEKVKEEKNRPVKGPSGNGGPANEANGKGPGPGEHAKGPNSTAKASGSSVVSSTAVLVLVVLACRVMHQGQSS